MMALMETITNTLLSMGNVQGLPQLSGWSILAIVAVVIWTFAWKGLALWKAARLSHRNWFIALLILNTFGIVEIIYIYFVAKKFTVETVEK
jgi:hypothetical protein